MIPSIQEKDESLTVNCQNCPASLVILTVAGGKAKVTEYDNVASIALDQDELCVSFIDKGTDVWHDVNFINLFVIDPQ